MTTSNSKQQDKQSVNGGIHNRNGLDNGDNRASQSLRKLQYSSSISEVGDSDDSDSSNNNMKQGGGGYNIQIDNNDEHMQRIDSNLDYQRNDSLTSMADKTIDSGVQSYISPSTSSGSEREFKLQRTVPNSTIVSNLPPSSPVTTRRDTINSLRRDSTDSSVIPPAPPEHPFFSPSFYDQEADVSDHSVVYQSPGAVTERRFFQQQSPQHQKTINSFLSNANNNNSNNNSSSSNNHHVSNAKSKSKPQAHRGRSRRDAFASFGSEASNGSFRRLVPSNHGKSTGGQLPPAAAPVQAKPVMTMGQLPYHERRKLLAQRAQEQKKQQEQQQKKQQQQQPVLGDPNIFIPNILPNATGSAPLATPYGIVQPLPSVPLVPAPQPPVPVPANVIPSLAQYVPAPIQLTPYKPIGGTTSAANPNPLPPRPNGNNAPPLRPRTHSSDSLKDGNGKVTSEKKDIPPPPQTPPPPPSYAHVRGDSMGSISSLGSFDKGVSGKDDEENFAVEDSSVSSSKSSSSASFFQRFAPWRTQLQQKQQEPTVDDYHRKNQDFLRKANSKRQIQDHITVSSPMQQQHKRVGSLTQPPPTRGSHRRLDSIDNDNWDEEEKGGESNDSVEKVASRHSSRRSGNLMLNPSRSIDTSTSGTDNSSTEGDNSHRHFDDRSQSTGGSLNDNGEASETAFLLNKAPSTSSNHEASAMRSDRPSTQSSRRSHRPRKMDSVSPSSSEYFISQDSSKQTVRLDNTTATAMLEYEIAQKKDRLRKKKKKKKKRTNKSKRKHRSRRVEQSDSSDSSLSTVDNQWLSRRTKDLEQQRAALFEQWKAEARAEEERERKEREKNSWSRKVSRFMNSKFGSFIRRVQQFFIWLESFIANLPLTIGAIALALANLGVVWYKFTEENLSSCEPVHFHSSQCTFPEFPGCFYCDTDSDMYRAALGFHETCSFLAGVVATLFIAKLILATQVVFDELSSPTTATPAGLLCMTLDIVFAGKGFLGQVVVSVAASIHLCLAVWFIYMALAYHIMPEPSWFPNTVSIGISAVKIWLYYPMAGHFLMAISLSLNFFFFPISLIRVFLNRKISATVGWMQMSAPNVSLYALTLMAQPSFEEENPDVTKFQKIHRAIYLPCMHFFFALCIIGITASIHSFIVRWPTFKKVPFSPAHAAFCVPTLSHANAIQAYRAAVNSFSDLEPDSLYKRSLYIYWVTVLISGTIITLGIVVKYLLCLSEWTQIEVGEEVEPPAPFDTNMTSSNLISAGETLIQNFVSPAILQANETGALVLTRNMQGDQVYRRTRRVTALGFEPIMSRLDMDVERELLLDWVGKHPPRRRHRTLSVPGIDFSYNGSGGFGTGNIGVYGATDIERPSQRHTRSSSEFVRRPFF